MSMTIREQRDDAAVRILAALVAKGGYEYTSNADIAATIELANELVLQLASNDPDDT